MRPNSSNDTGVTDSKPAREGNVTRHTFEDSVRPSVAVVEAVATATGYDPYDVPPLYEVVDPDALDDLFASKHDGTPRRTGRVTFRLAGCDVTVTGRGEVVVCQRETAPASSDSSSAPGLV